MPNWEEMVEAEARDILGTWKKQNPEKDYDTERDWEMARLMAELMMLPDE